MINSELTNDYWNIYGNQMQNDTLYHGHSELYQYNGTRYPELAGTVMTGHEINYIGVGAGYAAYGIPLWLAVQLTIAYYERNHGGASPDLNVLTALLAGYNAYKRTGGGSSPTGTGGGGCVDDPPADPDDSGID